MATPGRIYESIVDCAGFGTCRTLGGVGKYLKEGKSSVRIITVEPVATDHNLPGMAIR